MSNGDGNGNGNSTRIPLSVSLFGTATVVIGIAVISAFWMLSDPRTEIRSIKDNYLQLREHEEFKSRVDRTFQQLADQNHQQEEKFLSRNEFDRWKYEHDKLTIAVQADIAEMKRTLQSTSTAMAHAEKDKAVLDAFEKRLDNIRADVSALMRQSHAPFPATSPATAWPSPDARR